MISAGVFLSSITLCHFQLIFLKKSSHVRKSTKVVKIHKNLSSAPQKKAYSKKTVYCLTGKLNDVKLLWWARHTFCSVYALQASQESHWVVKKRRKTEKKKEKNEVRNRVSNQGATGFSTSVVNGSSPLLNIGKSFVSFSRAVKRMTFILAGIPTVLLCNDLWSFHGEFWFSHRENRRKPKNRCSFSEYAAHPTKNMWVFIFLMPYSNSPAFFDPALVKKQCLKKFVSEIEKHLQSRATYGLVL